MVWKVPEHEIVARVLDCNMDVRDELMTLRKRHVDASELTQKPCQERILLAFDCEAIIFEGFHRFHQWSSP